jgi:hypothetical protein
MRGSVISLFIALAAISLNTATYAGEKKPVQSDVVEESQNAEEAVNSATKK